MGKDSKLVHVKTHFSFDEPEDQFHTLLRKSAETGTLEVLITNRNQLVSVQLHIYINSPSGLPSVYLLS